METQDLINRIYAVYQSAQGNPRTYLGGSSLGYGMQCSRRLWYSFRHVSREDFDGRMLRLFQHGHHEEVRVLKDLKDIGLEVISDGDGHTGQVDVQAFHGLVRGHIDGLVREEGGPWMLFECKTGNRKSFNSMAKDGVFKSKPVHYAQMQTYMGLLQQQWPEHMEGAPPACALYIMVCKDDERIHAELVSFDAPYFEQLGELARETLEAVAPPERPFTVPDYKHCTYCPHIDVCWEGGEPDHVCGGCANYETDMEAGEHVCTLKNTIIKPYYTCEQFSLLDALSPGSRKVQFW